jgi:hypothetical protein
MHWSTENDPQVHKFFLNLMNLQKTLRRLILGEIILSVVIVTTGFLEERFLPAELRSYLDIVAAQDLSIKDGLVIALGVPHMILLIVSWLALWQGWRSGRLLYTITWISSAPLLGLCAPLISGPVVASLEPLMSLVSGLILGLLYFSELRFTYKP